MLFFYGTLRYPPLLARVLGRDPGPLEPARLPGHRAVMVDGQAFPTLLPGGEGTEGVLFDPAPGELARLDAYEGGFAHRTVTMDVETAAGTVPARVYFPEPGTWPPGAPFVLEDWVARWGAMALDAGAEIMERLDAGQAAETVQALHGPITARAWDRQLARDTAPAEIRSAGDPVEVLRYHPGFDGFFRFRQFELRHRQFDGSWTPAFRRECFIGFDAALVLPYDPATDRVLVIEQLRLAPVMRGDPRPMLLEPVAGLVEAGEDPEACARREAGEEAGLALGRMERIARVYASPGYSTEFFHCYLGLAELDGVDQRLGGADGEIEDIKSHVMPLDDALALTETGEINVAPLAMMLHWLARHRARLRGAS